MAVTNCPECGGMVSTSVDQCIHCGCKFVICPECGQASKVGAEKCLQCGYIYAKVEQEVVAEPSVAKTVVNEVPKLPKCKTVQDDWEKNHKPVISKVLSKVNLFFTITFVVSLVVAVIAMAASSLNFGTPANFFAVSAVLLLISMPLSESDLLDAVIELIDFKSFWKWSRQNGNDLVAMHKAETLKVRQTVGVSDQINKLVEVRTDNEFSLDTIYYNTRASGASLIVCAVIKLLVVSVCTLLFSAFIISNLHINLQSLSSINNLWMLIAAIVLYAAIKLIMWLVKSVILESPRDKMTDEIEKVD